MTQALPFPSFFTESGGNQPASQLDANFAAVQTSLTTEATVSSNSTVDLGAQSSNIIAISGTSTISSFGSSATTAQPLYFLRATGAFTIAYNVTSMMTLTGASVTVAAGDKLTFQYLGSGNWAMLYWSGLMAPALGTSGQVLTSNGTTAAPSYQSISGNLVLIQTQTASNSATINFTGIPATYDQYEVRFTGVLPVTNGSYLVARVGEGATPTWESSLNYTYGGFYSSSNNTSGSLAGVGVSAMFVTGSLGTSSTTSTGGVSGKMTFMGLGSTSIWKQSRSEMVLINGSGIIVECSVNNVWAGDTNAITGLQFFFATGNIASGDFSLYGVVK